jgi:hypothetical protein
MVRTRARSYVPIVTRRVNKNYKATDTARRHRLPDKEQKTVSVTPHKRRNP